MLTLLLLRHGKAVPQAGGDDAARALTDGGRADARALGSYLRDHGLTPDRALVSPSVRTRQTLDAVLAGLGQTVSAAEDARLYNATAAQISTLIAATDPAVETLLVVAHNPGVMDLALATAGDGDVRDLDAMRSRFPPCSLAIVRFEAISWQDVRSGGGRLDDFVTPDRLALRS